jgi:hypothetical protein
MKTILALVFSIFVFGKCFSQSHASSHALQLQLEFLGPGVSSSLNLDSRFAKKDNGIGFRIGLGITPLGLLKSSCNQGSLNSLPIGINYLIGNKKHLLELGAGGVALFISGTKVYCLNMEKHFFSEETDYYWFTSIGYRYQPLHKKGLTYRIFVSPLFQKDFPVKFWGGASVGYRF